MKPTRQFVVTAVAAVALMIVGSSAQGEEKHSTKAPASSGSVLSMARFYGGASARIGDFPGKLVCLRCDIQPGPNAMAQCENKGHLHALSMQEDGMIHPLLPGTESVLKQINSGELHGKQVIVHGKYYPATGLILVDRITPAKTGS